MKQLTQYLPPYRHFSRPPLNSHGLAQNRRFVCSPSHWPCHCLCPCQVFEATEVAGFVRFRYTLESDHFSSLVHPLLLGRQAEVDRVRMPGESAVYRNYATGTMGRVRCHHYFYPADNIEAY